HPRPRFAALPAVVEVALGVDVQLAGAMGTGPRRAVRGRGHQQQGRQAARQAAAEAGDGRRHDPDGTGTRALVVGVDGDRVRAAVPGADLAEDADALVARAHDAPAVEGEAVDAARRGPTGAEPDHAVVVGYARLGNESGVLAVLHTGGGASGPV